MKIKKQYIFIGLIIIAVSFIGFSYLISSKTKDVPIVESEPNQNSIYLNTNLNTNEQTEAPETPIQKNNESESSQSSTNIKSINVSLIVEDKKYEAGIEEGSSVFDAMEKMQNESTSNNIFDFKYTNNAALGNFITEINGQYGTPGKYWIYYVNDKKASVGVSNYILKEGDIIKWSQEGI